MKINSLFRKKSIEDIQKDHEASTLNKVLTIKDITFFGIAAIIGAGIFSTIGRASYEGGPAVALLFVFVAIACVFTALCYAEFSSMIPVSGSAYTYAYFSLGEIFAWVIGWALIMEYAVSNIVISISWSGYFVTMLEGFGIHWPNWLAIDYHTAKEAYKTIASGESTDIAQRWAGAYESAPELLGIKVLFNLPAGIITLIVTYLAYLGIKESVRISNFLVWLKLAAIIGIILVGAFYVKPDNWTPFMPNGVGGVMAGVSAVFFSFIGFDSLSTTAEETKNPQRDMPRAMLLCIIICVVLYVGVTLVITGMTHYSELRVDDPLAYVFSKVNLDFIAGVVSVIAVLTMTGAILVYQIGQPRIWMKMSQDGLLWKKFGKIHPKHRTPGFATIIAGIFVGIPAMFLDMQIVVDLTSVGTLFAFILVCSGVLFLDYRGLTKHAKFKIPYINSQYLLLIAFVIGFGLLLLNIQDYRIQGVKSFNQIFTIFQNKPLLIVFWLVWLGLAISAFKYKFSLFPILGILFNLYLMTELNISNWLMFSVWLILGIVIYCIYGRKNSKLIKSIENR